MKRDVKVGLFVAGVVCSVAALLLGGGTVGRSRSPRAPLGLSSHPDTSAALPAELSESVLPPADAEECVDETGGLSVEDVAIEGDPSARQAGAVGGGPMVEAASEALSDEELGGIFGALEDGAATAEEPARPSEAGSSAPEEELDIVDLSLEELLAREAGAEKAPLVAGARKVAAAPALRIGPPAPAIALPPPAKHVYLMKEGDSFWTVSKRLYGAGKYYKDILSANPDVEPRKLRPGDRIAIPEIPGAPMRRELLADPAKLARKRKPREYLAEDKEHTVQPGETLEDISLKYYGYKHKWPHIRAANLDLEPRRIRPGDKIVIPALTE